MPGTNIFEWAQANGYLGEGDDTQYYTNPAASGISSEEYGNFITQMDGAITDPADRLAFFQALVDMGALPAGTGAQYWADGGDPASGDTIEHLASVVSESFGSLAADPGGLTETLGDAAGTDTSAGFGGGLTAPPVTAPGGSIIPAGASLLVVDNTDLGGVVEYFLQYDLGTADSPFEVTFSIGDQAEFDHFFPSGLNMNTTHYSGTDFRNMPIFGMNLGTINDIEGAEESLAQQVAEDLALLGLEGIPSWVQGDNAAMLAVITASNEGWSPDRLAQELSGTAGFQDRFPGFAAYMAASGDSTVLGNFGNYLADEDTFRQLLRQMRGPHTDTSNEYIGTLLASGWSATEAQNVLRAEAQFNDNPEALADLNAILSSRGMAAISQGDFLEVLRGNTDALPGEIYDAINDAMFLDSLVQQGIAVDELLSESFGTDVAEFVAGPGAFDEMARDIAVALSDASIDTAIGKFGLTANDLITGLASNEGETLSLLSKLARERREGGAGFSSSTAQVDERGRLRIAGLGNV